MLKKQRSLFCDPDDLISVTQQVKCLISVCHSHLSGLNLYNCSVFCRKDGFTIKQWNVNINIMRYITCNSVICVPLPAHLVHMNQLLSAFGRAWCPADHCNLVCSSRETLYSLHYLSFYSFYYWPLLFHGLNRTSLLTKNIVKACLTFHYQKFCIKATFWHEILPTEALLSKLVCISHGKAALKVERTCFRWLNVYFSEALLMQALNNSGVIPDSGSLDHVGHL